MHVDEETCTGDALRTTGILNLDQDGTSAGDALHTDPNEVSDPLIDVTVMAAGNLHTDPNEVSDPFIAVAVALETAAVTRNHLQAQYEAELNGYEKAMHERELQDCGELH